MFSARFCKFSQKFNQEKKGYLQPGGLQRAARLAAFFGLCYAYSLRNMLKRCSDRSNRQSGFVHFERYGNHGGGRVDHDGV